MEKEKIHLNKTKIVLQNKIKEEENRITSYKETIKKIMETFNDDLVHMDSAEVADLKNTMEKNQIDISYSQKSIVFKNRQLKRPYFGRIDFEENGTVGTYYIGLGHIQENEETLCYDWRAPISSVYYDDDVGEAYYEINNSKFYGQLLLKRQYKIENGELIYYIDTNETVNDDILQTVLSQNTSAHMKEIVATIQKEQNKLIRADEYRNFLVQGVAGSGKTSIALHRASYLLYKHRDDFKNSDIIILSPSNLFSSYISEVLPELGEENVLEMTFAHIAKLELEKPMETREEIVDRFCKIKSQEIFDCVAYKSSFAYLKDLKEFLGDVFAKLFSPIDLIFKAYENIKQDSPFVITKEEIGKFYYETYGSLEVRDRIEYMAEYFSDRFNLNKKETLLVKDRLKTMLYKMFPITDIYKINELFLTRQGLVFDEMKEISYDDIAGLLIIKDYIFGLSQKYKTKYVIIDEMQDFSPAHFYLFNKMWDCSKIILGDVNQCIEKKLSENYIDELSNFLNAKYIYLKKSYRSTKQITEFCNKIIDLKDVTVMSREGDNVEIEKTPNTANAIKKIINSTNDKFAHTAIICKSFEEANSLYEQLKKDINIHLVQGQDISIDEKVIITTASTSKGIEFDHVIIPFVTDENYRGTLGKNLLYVACSRALHKLNILYDGKISTLIDFKN